MSRTPQDVPDAELAVLQVLWDSGPSTRRRLADALYPGGGASRYTTVQKLLERLQDKGYVTQGQGPDGITFTAAVGRDALITRRLDEVARKLCGGSVAPLLTNLVEAGRLSEEELQQLRELIRDAGRKPGAKGGKR